MEPNARESSRPPESRHWNPYVAGLFLGLTLLVSYVVLGAGLGASSGIARIGAWIEGLLLPAHVADSAYFGGWGDAPLVYYLVYMFAGTLFGGFVAAYTAGRTRLRTERGASFPAAGRLFLALVGGVLVGFASRLAAGCTSGQALAGGALLLNGSLLFLVAMFASGFATAWMFRRQWDD